MTCTSHIMGQSKSWSCLNSSLNWPHIFSVGWLLSRVAKCNWNSMNWHFATWLLCRVEANMQPPSLLPPSCSIFQRNKNQKKVCTDLGYLCATSDHFVWGDSNFGRPIYLTLCQVSRWCRFSSWLCRPGQAAAAAVTAGRTGAELIFSVRTIFTKNSQTSA